MPGPYHAVHQNFNPLFPYGKRLNINLRLANRLHFNPLFPYGKRPDGKSHRAGGNISIHSSHTGRDRLYELRVPSSPLFQSTLPIREETRLLPEQDYDQRISIHSSHTGRDMLPSPIGGTQCDFNPLFPYGKRRERQLAQQQERIFQSTLPIREETWFGSSPWAHAPPFQSTLPIREETGRPPRVIALGTISIHSSHTGRDSRAALGDSVCHHFNPLFPYGKRRSDCSARRKANTFQSTLPIREETLWRP